MISNTFFICCTLYALLAFFVSLSLHEVTIGVSATGALQRVSQPADRDYVDEISDNDDDDDGSMSARVQSGIHPLFTPDHLKAS